MADESTPVAGQESAAPPVSLPPVTPSPPAPSSPEPVAPEPATPPAVPPPSSVGVRDILTQRGVDVSGFASDEAAADALLGAAQKWQQGREYAELGEKAAPQWSEFETWQVEQKAAAESAPTQPDEWSWDAPEFDPAWLRYLDGNGGLSPDTPVIVANKLQDYVNWEQGKQREFLRDPRAAIGGMHDKRFGEIDDRFKGLQPGETIEQAVGRLTQEKLAAHTAQQQAEAYYREHEKKYFVTDATGNKLLDPTTGQYALNPQGKAFAQYQTELRQGGMTDEATVRQWAEHRLAQDETAGRFKATPPGQPPAPTPPASTPKETFLQAALHGQQPPAADGTVPAPNEPAPPDGPLDALKMAEELLRETGDIP